MRILLVSQMYPGPDAPDLGVFVRDLERGLAARGHEIERAVLDRRDGGRSRYLELLRETRRGANAFRPDVVYAHFLVPTGLIAVLAGRGAGRAPVVVTAHGQDVANVGRRPGVGLLTRFTVGRAARVIAVSRYLADELAQKVPRAREKTQVVDCGVDTQRFQPRDRAEARRELGWQDEDPLYVCVGSLTERKNVLRLARAVGQLERGSLVFVGDGPLRSTLEDLPRVTLAGAVEHERVERWLAAANVVCQPSLVEPFGQAVLEALACGRPVVATRVGGPPEFVPPEAGVLVDPTDERTIAEALRAAARLASPNEAARAAALQHSLERQAERIDAILTAAAATRREAR